MQPIIQQNEMFKSVIEQNLKQQMAAKQAAMAPRPPDPATATYDQMVQYAQQSASFIAEQQQQRYASMLEQQQKSMLNEFRSSVAKFEQAQQAAAYQARESAYSNAVNGLTQRPGMQWLQDPVKQAVLRTLYERTSQNGMSLSQTASELAKSFGIGAQASAATSSRAMRNASTMALKDQRVRTQVNKAPSPAAGGKGGPGKRTVADKMKANGVKTEWLPPDLQQLYGLKN